MKPFINLKFLIVVFFILNLNSTIINKESLNLYSQNPELFEHTWYFHYGFLDGEDFYPLSYLRGELYFMTDLTIQVAHPYCEEGFTSYINQINNQVFILEDDVEVILIGTCSSGDEQIFMDRHYSIYGTMDGTGFAKNPFTYTISTINNYFQLTIENGVGDWAVYNSVLLSTQGFNQNKFTIYPNPVIETLQISQQTPQKIRASIFDVHGKKLQQQTFENSTSTFDVKALNPGLYFVVLESELGERVSKKFVKQ